VQPHYSATSLLPLLDRLCCDLLPSVAHISFSEIDHHASDTRPNNVVHHRMSTWLKVLQPIADVVKFGDRLKVRQVIILTFNVIVNAVSSVKSTMAGSVASEYLLTTASSMTIKDTDSRTGGQRHGRGYSDSSDNSGSERRDDDDETLTRFNVRLAGRQLSGSDMSRDRKD